MAAMTLTAEEVEIIRQHRDKTRNAPQVDIELEKIVDDVINEEVEKEVTIENIQSDIDSLKEDISSLKKQSSDPLLHERLKMFETLLFSIQQGILDIKKDGFEVKREVLSDMHTIKKYQSKFTWGIMVIMVIVGIFSGVVGCKNEKTVSEFSQPFFKVIGLVNDVKKVGVE